MDSVQVGKAVFVKVSFASLGFEPRTFSYPGSCANNTLLAKKFILLMIMVKAHTVCFVAICAFFLHDEKISGLVSDLQPVDI